MAEININETHLHSSTRHTDTSQSFVTAITWGDCALAHPLCAVSGISTAARRGVAEALVNATTLAKRTGEINTNPSHNHSLTRYKKLAEAGIRDISLNNCPSGHAVCDQYYDNPLTVVSTLSEDTFSLANAQGSSEINLNWNHPHTNWAEVVQVYADNWPDYQFGTCSSGHSYCKSDAHAQCLIFAAGLSRTVSNVRLL